MIRGHAQDPFCSGLLANRKKSRKDVMAFAAKDAQAEFEAPRLGHIVGRLGTRREPPFVDPRGTDSGHQLCEQGSAAEWSDDLAGEPLRVHSRLDDADRLSHFPPSSRCRTNRPLRFETLFAA